MQNARDGAKIDASVFSRSQEVGVKTNLIIFSVPLCQNRLILSRFIDQTNIRLFDFTRNNEGSCFFINLNSFLNSSSFTFYQNNPKRFAKIRIAEKVSTIGFIRVGNGNDVEPNYNNKVVKPGASKEIQILPTSNIDNDAYCTIHDLTCSTSTVADTLSPTLDKLDNNFL